MVLALRREADGGGDADLESGRERGVLLEGKVYVEAPTGALVQDLLFQDGWESGEPWTLLRRDLGAPVPDPGVRVEVSGPEQAHEWAAALRASFDGSTFTDERWHAMAAGAPYVGAVATYQSAGLEQLPERRDLYRNAS